jgi:hypothetical protein
MERRHIKELLLTYGDKFAMIGSLTTGIFSPFYNFLFSFSNIAPNVKMISWIRCQVFPYGALSFCEQVFYMSILYRNIYGRRFALLNPQKSKLLLGDKAIGLYGIQNLSHPERVFMNKCILGDIYLRLNHK